MSKAFSSRLLGSRLWSQYTAAPVAGFFRRLSLQRLGQQPLSTSTCLNPPAWWHVRPIQTVTIPHFMSSCSTKRILRSTGLLKPYYKVPTRSYHHGGLVRTSIKLPQQQQCSYSNEKKPAKEHAIARRSSTSPERKRPESSQQQQEVPGQPNSEGDNESIASSVSKYLHLPKLPHRPAKEELLAAANGFWERLKVRFKWMSIRSMRPWNADEWGAFVSWFMLGHIVWILVGTTTFFSLLIFSINTVFAQGKRLANSLLRLVEALILISRNSC